MKSITYWQQAMPPQNYGVYADHYAPSQDETGASPIGVILGAVTTVATSVVLADAQKKFGEKLIAIQKTVADKQFEVNSKLTAAEVEMLSLQKGITSGTQNIAIDVATVQKDAIVAENEIQRNNALADKDLRDAQGISISFQGISIPQESELTTTIAQQQGKILGLKRGTFFTVAAVSAAGVGGWWFLGRKK